MVESFGGVDETGSEYEVHFIENILLNFFFKKQRERKMRKVKQSQKSKILIFFSKNF